jgi:hypothetical protein
VSDEILGREAFLAHAGELPTEKVVIEGWGTAIIQGLSAAARDSYEASVVVLRRGKGGRTEEGRDFDNVRAKLVVRCLIGTDGRPLFGAHEYDLVGQLPAMVIDKLWEAATRLSGMTEEDIEELAGDFPETPPERSGSPSPSPSAAPSPS